MSPLELILDFSVFRAVLPNACREGVCGYLNGSRGFGTEVVSRLQALLPSGTGVTTTSEKQKTGEPESMADPSALAQPRNHSQHLSL